MKKAQGQVLADNPGPFRHNQISRIWRKWIVPWIRLPVESTRRREAGIKGDFRSFSCKRCGKCVRICRRCDRGQRYCSPACSRQARRFSVRAAERRYRESEPGHRGNARRQREYYRRNQLRKENLTHQGSVQAESRHIVQLEGRAEALRLTVRSDGQTARCDFCGRELYEDTKTDSRPRSSAEAAEGRLVMGRPPVFA